VMIFSSAMALDRLQFVRAELAHSESEVDAVVGMQWLAILPYEQKVRNQLTLLHRCADTDTEPHCLVSCARRQQMEVEYSVTHIPRCSPSGRQ